MYPTNKVRSPGGYAMEKPRAHTTAICPACGTLVPGRIMKRDGRILLEKLCLDRGIAAAVICSDPGRLMKCCNHYPGADGSLVPLCGWNVFPGLIEKN